MVAPRNRPDVLNKSIVTLLLLGRVALGAQRPIVVKLSRERSVGRSVRLSVCPVHCGKTGDRIRCRSDGSRDEAGLGFGDRSTGMGTFGHA